MNTISKYIGRSIYWTTWPIIALFVRNTRRSGVLLVCKGEILLVKNVISGDNSWTLPGGGTKGTETDKVCAARELKEELGITIDPVDLRELGEYNNKGRGYSYTSTLFALACDKSRKIKKGPEIRKYSWFPVKNLPVNTKPVVKEAISRIKQG